MKTEIRHEDEFCPVFCHIAELEDEIENLKKMGDEYFPRRKFLEGVFHARILISCAAVGGA